MVSDPESKVVLITGALSDIGRATATSFAKAGYSVALNYHRKEEQARAFAESLVRECHAPQVKGFQTDIRNRQEVAAMFEQACLAFGKVDVLVNNAGTNQDRAFLAIMVQYCFKRY
jgi:NAD(P)-dependent dehydrogenase (short-subunit alcohol dehydrogenase family)